MVSNSAGYHPNCALVMSRLERFANKNSCSHWPLAFTACTSPSQTTLRYVSVRYVDIDNIKRHAQ